MVAAFQVLINCLEESDALLPGQFPDALGVYMEMVKSRKGDVSDMTLAVLSLSETQSGWQVESNWVMLLVDERCLQPDFVGADRMFRSRASLQVEILTLRH